MSYQISDFTIVRLVDNEKHPKKEYGYLFIRKDDVPMLEKIISQMKKESTYDIERLTEYLDDSNITCQIIQQARLVNF